LGTRCNDIETVALTNIMHHKPAVSKEGKDLLTTNYEYFVALEFETAMAKV